MGKHGPCRHCGVATTPLWRNGPPDKPVLCNACGSRWRTKGSLTNYTPLHARELIDSEDFKVSKVRSIPFKPKQKKVNKFKQMGGPVESEHEMPYSDQNFRKILEADTSNRSSSGSAISYSESCAQFGTTEASDLTGSAQSNVWESLVPSKKRTCVARPKPSSVEKLTKDLCTILHEQQSSYRSFTEEDLLYPTPMGSFEISTGSVLLRFPNKKTVEEESEASSLPRDNKSYAMNGTYSRSSSFPVHSGFKGTGVSVVCAGKLKKSAAYMAQEHMKRDKTFSDQLHVLRDIDSPLAFTDLKGEKREQNSAGKGVETGHSSLTPLKRPLDIQNQHVPEPNDTIRSPNRLSKSGGSGTNLPSTITSQPNSSNAGSKSIYDAEEFVDTDGACFSPRSFFATPPDQSSMLCSLQFTDASSDHELLLDVPSNMSSYPEAELLYHPRNRKPGVPSNSESRFVADEEESLSNFPRSSLGSQQPRRR